MPLTPDTLTSARLAETYRRAAAIKRRRLMVAGSLAIAVLAVAGVAGVAWPGGDEDEVRTVAGPDTEATTTTAPPDTFIETTTTLPPPTTVTTAPGRFGTTTTVKPRSGGSTPTTAVCRNSYDQACGPFRWDPQPANRPMDVEVSSSPQEAKVGQEVAFTVRVRDDGPVYAGSCGNGQSYGDGTHSTRCSFACAGPLKYGPWDPPPPKNSSFTETFRHTYEGPGAFTAEFEYNGGDCTFSPFSSQGRAMVQVTVTP